MGAAYVAERGTLSINNGTTTSQAITVSANCTAGATIILLWASRDTSTASISVSDTKSNTWTVDVGPSNGSNNLVFIASTRQNGGALTTSDTVTCSFGTAPGNARLATLEEFSGLAAASYVDQTASATSASTTSFATGTTAATTQADEVAVYACCIALNGGTSPDAAYSDFTTAQSNQTGTPDAISKTLRTGYKILSSTGTQSATPTAGGNASYQGVIVTYKAAAVATVPMMALMGVGS